MIPREKVDEIISRTDLGALIGRYVTLKQQGKDLKGLCPFHNEKTPSFVVHPDRGFYKCFGCGEGGGPVQFLMKIEGIDYGEAVRILAEQAGITVTTTPAEKRALTERDILRKVMKTAVLFYHETLLNSPLGKEARAYLKKRGVELKLAAAYQLGYAPEGGDFLARHLRGRNFEYEVMEKAGLARRGNRDFYDYFKGRIVFPIADSQGRFIGMGGRGMSDDVQPKYLNTPQTPIFSKKDVLYGLHLAKAAIRKEERVVVVEGYMDAISLCGAGVENVVASMGTSLTEEQARAIARYTNKVIFAYDADIAGEAATVRGIEIFEKAGLQVRIMSMPAGEDPDSIVRKKGAAAFMELVNKARSIIDYKVNFLKNKHDLATPEGKEEFVKEITPILKEIRGEVRRSEYIRVISEKFHITEELLRRSVGGTRMRRKVNMEPVVKKNGLEPDEKLLVYLFDNPQYVPLCTQLEQEPKYSFDDEIFEPDLLYIYRNLQYLDITGLEAIGAEVLNGIVTDDSMLKRAVDLAMVEGLPRCDEEEIRAIFAGLRKKTLLRRKAALEERIALEADNPELLLQLTALLREIKGANGTANPQK